MSVRSFTPTFGTLTHKHTTDRQTDKQTDKYNDFATEFQGNF